MRKGSENTRTFHTGHQCCYIHPLTSSIGCYCYYDLLESGRVTGGLRLFTINENSHEIRELDATWLCEDAGIYEFQIRKIDELHWFMYAIDTLSRVWLISCVMTSQELKRFEFLALDMIRINSDGGQSQGTCVRLISDLNVLSAATMSGDLLVSDLGDFRVLWQKAKAHEAEILCTGLIPQHKLIATGAEDMMVKFWDIRQAEECLRLERAHAAGVTAISSVYQSSRTTPADASNYILTGSYDDTVRLFDIRQPAEPVDLQKTEGGVWDFAWSATYPGHFLLPNCFGGLKRGFLANVAGPATSWGGNALSADDAAVHSSPECPINVNVDTCIHLIPLVPADKNDQALFYAANWFCEDTLVVSSSYYERNLVVLTVAN